MNTELPPTPTRRDVLRKGGGAAIGVGLLAGCTGKSSTGGETNGSNGSGTGTTTNREDSYSVTMAPMGTVKFERVPESVFTRLTHLAGMAFALGRGDDVNALHAPEYYHALWNQFTERLDGVSVDWKGLYSSWKPSKEKFYELDSDVHLADPASVYKLQRWGMDDISEVRENIGPWFGNTLSDTHQQPPAEWADAYQYYSLWGMFEKVAQVFRERARYEALAEIHAGMLETIEKKLPPANDRPTVAMITSVDFKKIWAYKVNAPGFLTAHTRPLGAVDAFGDSVRSGDTVDFEALLEADPDVILFLGGLTPENNMAKRRQTLERHSVAREIAAVKNDRVCAQGARYQGPILNLFQLEMTAKQLYPEQFGEWPTYVDGPYPELPEDEQLFDRTRVADSIKGDF